MDPLLFLALALLGVGVYGGGQYLVDQYYIKKLTGKPIVEHHTEK